jgi:hypothetical protein
MKKIILFFTLLIPFTNAFSQTTTKKYKVAKIIKTRNLKAVDEYNNPKENYVKVELTLDNGQKEIIEYNSKFRGIDFEGKIEYFFGKNIVFKVSDGYYPNGLYQNGISIKAFEYVLNKKTNKYYKNNLYFNFDLGNGFSEKNSIEIYQSKNKITQYGFVNGNFEFLLANQDNGFRLFIDKKADGSNYLNVTEFSEGGDK